jgi:hypothetical protein
LSVRDDGIRRIRRAARMLDGLVEDARRFRRLAFHRIAASTDRQARAAVPLEWRRTGTVMPFAESNVLSRPCPAGHAFAAKGWPEPR